MFVDFFICFVQVNFPISQHLTGLRPDCAIREKGPTSTFQQTLRNLKSNVQSVSAFGSEIYCSVQSKH